ncbi:MAG: hypothetical protein Q4E12_02815 [Coriobacteriia bacterium]|nr:hypothetical protein [Coriobacteriia bacterium]
MLQRDYLMRLFAAFFQAIIKSLEKQKEKDPLQAADTLEEAISQATEIDGSVLLSLAPESMASILQVSGTDPRVIEYVANSLKLESEYLQEAGEGATANLRLQQAQALADAYGIELAKTIEDFLEQVDKEVNPDGE